MEPQLTQHAPPLSTPDEILEVSGLRKAFGSTLALDDVSLTIPVGSVVGLLGPNGAGKTTLLKVVVGLVHADAGDVRFDPYVKRGAVGAFIERPGFYPYLTARENLIALGLTAGLAPLALKDTVPSALARVDLQAAAERRFAEFSTGMKQRLGIAAALLNGPRFLLLDEPVSGLDPAGVALIRNLLAELHAAGTTILVSSHLLGEVEHLCDRIIIISRGQVMANGPIADIASGPGVWRLRFAAADQAQRAAAVLGETYVVKVTESEVEAVPKVESGVSPMDLVAPMGLIPREAFHQRPSLEDAYLRLTSPHGAGQG